MKRLIIILSTLLFLFDVLFPQQTQWCIASGTAGNNIAALDVYRKDPDTLYAIGALGTIRSTDKGEHWDTIHGFRTDMGAIRTDPNDSKIIYESYFGRILESNDISMTTDGGLTWRDLFIGRIYPVAVIEIDPIDPSGVFIGVGPRFIYHSTDRGQSWTLLNIPSPSVLSSLAVDPTNDNILYAGYFNGIFKSSDGGNSWNALSLGFTVQSKTKIAIDPRNPSIIYVTVYAYTDTVPGGVYKSTDGGSNWTEINNGLATNDDRGINTIAINPKSSNEIFLGSDNLLQPIMRSTNGGSSWSSFNKGLPGTFVSSFALDTLNNRLYCNASNFNFPESSGVFILDSQLTAVNENHSKEFTYTLYQNYPNPFNPSTNIRFEIVRSEFVSLTVYDILGKQVTILVNERKNPGSYFVSWNAERFSSGTYFYRLTMGNFVQTRKMILQK